MKKCVKCFKLKSSGEFNYNPYSKDHLSNSCEECINARRVALVEAGKQVSKSTLYPYSFLKKYGLSEFQYKEMIQAQRGLCAICKQTNGKRKLVVDHCHTSGKTRQLLCHKCNIGLGCFRDSSIVLQEAIKYISKYS